MIRILPKQRSIMAALDFVGLGNPLRGAKRAVLSRRHGGWIPLVPERAFTECCRQAIGTLRSKGQERFGDYFEFGVSRGTSFACMHNALEAEGLNSVRLIGFDSFEGMPPESAEEGWVPGQFRSTIDQTRTYLTERGVDWGRAHLVPGWFRETLTEATRQEFKLTNASLVMVDCDIYSASRDVLWFVEPLIRERAVIFFDDWGPQEAKREIGQQEAFAEFQLAFPSLQAQPLESYADSARVFLLERQRYD